MFPNIVVYGKFTLSERFVSGLYKRVRGTRRDLDEVNTVQQETLQSAFNQSRPSSSSILPDTQEDSPETGLSPKR